METDAAAINPDLAKLIAVNMAVFASSAILCELFGKADVANAMMAQAMVLSGVEPDMMKAHARIGGIWQHLLDELKAEQVALAAEQSVLKEAQLNVVPFLKPANDSIPQ